MVFPPLPPDLGPCRGPADVLPCGTQRTPTHGVGTSRSITIFGLTVGESTFERSTTIT